MRLIADFNNPISLALGTFLIYIYNTIGLNIWGSSYFLELRNGSSFIGMFTYGSSLFGKFNGGTFTFTFNEGNFILFPTGIV